MVKQSALVDSQLTPMVSDILYVRFQVRDLEKQRTFLEDFGLWVESHDEFLLARGTDANKYIYVAEEGANRLVEIGFQVDSLEMLERIASIDEVPIEPLELPGRGVGIRLVDPDGNAIRVVYGLAKQEKKACPKRSPLNTGEQKLRLGDTIKFEESNHRVKRLGHCFLCVRDLKVSSQWYQSRLGMLISADVVDYKPCKRMIGTALRCNRKDAYVDFHTLFLLGNGKTEVGHIAFKVSDIDSLLIGHDQMLERGHSHVKGVGRHKISSQVFDYWCDPTGVVFESNTDGDMLTESDGLNVCSKEELLSSHWGSDGVPYADEVG